MAEDCTYDTHKVEVCGIDRDTVARMGIVDVVEVVENGRRVFRGRWATQDLFDAAIEMQKKMDRFHG